MVQSNRFRVLASTARRFFVCRLRGPNEISYQLAADAFIQQGRFERGDYHVAFKTCHMFCRSVLGSFNIPPTFRFGFTPLW